MFPKRTSSNGREAHFSYYPSSTHAGIASEKSMTHESFDKEMGKKFVTQEEIIKRFYNAIFVTQYSGSKYHTVLGQFEFSKESKIFAINAANMMSNFAEFS